MAETHILHSQAQQANRRKYPAAAHALCRGNFHLHGLHEAIFDRVLYVNPFCTDSFVSDAATGGVACFEKGQISAELPAGESGTLILEI